ncbi:hypothetical protein MASR1M32_14340 [Rhodobacter sp.]
MRRTAAAADDLRPPLEVLEDRKLPVPDDPPATAEDLVRALVEEADRYLAGLPGPGVTEVRTLIARWRDGPVRLPVVSPNAVVDRYLTSALEAVPGQPALTGAIAAAAPHLRWIIYDGYPPQEVGTDFIRSHAFCSLIGEAASIPAQDFDLGIFLIAPHVLYRDHAHPAPELYAPLTGPHGWRFGPDRPLVQKPAHRPVWNPAHQPHLTKVGAVPFLCLFGWTRDVWLPAHMIPASDWPELERLRLG